MKLHDLQFDDHAIAQFCQRHGIATLLLFGSIIRSDFGPRSDIDVIVDFSGEDRHSLLHLADMQLELTQMFGRQVHLHTNDMIHPYLRRRIRSAARVAYAA